MTSVVKTIALELGVSTASVSRALNDQPGVGDELRLRILDKATELNVHRNVVARGLVTSQTFAVGFFVRLKPGLSAYNDPFYGEILHGAERIISGTHYHLAIASLDDETLNNPDTFRFVRQSRIDGMILAGPDIPPGFILSMIQSELPVVLVDNVLEFSDAHSITSDDESGGYQAARHLLERGHQQIGMISGPADWASTRRRILGYQRALSEVGLSLSVVHVEQTTVNSGRTAFRQLIEQSPDVTAIGAVNDSMALGAIREARIMGRRVPEDLSFIGFDNISWTELTEPMLTTLDIPKQQMGFEAAQRLLALLNAPAAGLAATQLTLSVHLIERGSVAARPEPRR